MEAAMKVKDVMHKGVDWAALKLRFLKLPS
jgi:hypothetical protein